MIKADPKQIQAADYIVHRFLALVGIKSLSAQLRLNFKLDQISHTMIKADPKRVQAADYNSLATEHGRRHFVICILQPKSLCCFVEEA